MKSPSEKNAKGRTELLLSTRRGPEAELYDVAGVHLLSSQSDAKFVDAATRSTFHGRRASLLTSCLGSTDSQLNSVSQHRHTGFLTNPTFGFTDASLGGLPTKGARGNGDVQSSHTSMCLNFSPPMQRLYRSSKIRRCFRCFACTSGDVPNSCVCDSSCNSYAGYYKQIFTLYYRRHELGIFLWLLLLMAIVHVGILLLGHVFAPIVSTENRFGIHFFHSEWCRIAFLLLSALLSSVGLGILCSGCVWNSAAGTSTVSVRDEGTEEKAMNEMEQQVTYLMQARSFQQRLQWVHALGYLSCGLLSLGCLAWSVFFLGDRKNAVLWSDNASSYICFHNNSAKTNELKTQPGPSHSILPVSPLTGQLPDPSLGLWSVLWITVAVHGLFDLEVFFWRYALSVLTCLIHAVLVNWRAFVSHHQRTPGLAMEESYLWWWWCSPLDQFGSVQPVQTTTWWDDGAVLVFRMNFILLLAYIAAHLVGRTIAMWTVQHRYRLFLSTLHGQTRISRLQLVEAKLNELASMLVPAPLAAELSRDFIAGYQAWRSPLVIYLRNVSFLSAELTGLSHLASCVATSTCSSSSSAVPLSQQFAAFLHDLFSHFDRLAQREGCYRVRLNSGEYLCIAGYPDSRVDHARSCVQLGLNMLRAVRELSKATTCLELELKVAVHTGTAYAAVLGHTRLGFDLIGADVQFTDSLKQSATRPNCVLVSRTTFNQLPDGFRGETGPMFDYPSYPSFAAGPVGAVEPSTKLATYFVQSLGRENSLAETESRLTEISGPRSDRLSLDHLDPTNLATGLSRLAAAANAMVREAVNTPNGAHCSDPFEAPLNFLSDSGVGDLALLRQLRSSLVQALSPSDPIQDAEAAALIELATRDPSTSELLAMAAVTMAQSEDQEKETLVPCQRRAGRLRNKRASGDLECMDSVDQSMGKKTRHSMHVSLTTAPSDPGRCSETPLPFVSSTSPLSKPRLQPSESLWQPIVPAGFVPPSWITLDVHRSKCASSRVDEDPTNSSFTDRTKPDAIPAPSEEDLPTNDAHRMTPGQLSCVFLFHMVVLLPVVVTMAFVYLFSISGSFWLLFSYAGVLLYFVVLLVVFAVSRHLCWPPIRHACSVRFLALCSVVTIAGAALISLSTCQPAIPMRSRINGSVGQPQQQQHYNTVLLSQPAPIPTLPICPSGLESFVILTSLISLLPALCSHAIMFAASCVIPIGGRRKRRTDSGPLNGGPLISQATRFWLGVTLFVLCAAVYLWLAIQRGLGSTLVYSPEISPTHFQFRMSPVLLANPLLGLLLFAVLAFVLPRTMQYQSVLLDQWLRKSHETLDKLQHTFSALTHLLHTVAPAHTLSHVIQHATPVELYHNCESFASLLVIQLSCSSNPRAMSNSTSVTEPNTMDEDLNEPARMADRLRLINYLIGLIDDVAEGRPCAMDSTDGKSVEAVRSGLKFTKIHVSGTVIGYAMGCAVADAANLSNRPPRAEYRDLTPLLTFAERVIEACEYVNKKTKFAHTVHARIALHAGPTVAGLISQRRPVFTAWGDPLSVCLYLLHESHVPDLRRQHLLLATDEVMYHVPSSRLTHSAVAGRPLCWRCVDVQSGMVIPSTSTRGRRRRASESHNRPLHFCSVSATLWEQQQPENPEEDLDTRNRTSSALISLAKRASSRTPSLAAQRAQLKVKPITCVAVSKLEPFPLNCSGESPPTAAATLSLSDTHAQTEPLRIGQTPPPPPPPHHRAYPPSPTNGWTQASPFGDAATQDPSVRVRPPWPAGLAARREVISQYTVSNHHRHDYSIVNIEEPASPQFNRLGLARSAQRPQTQVFTRQPESNTPRATAGPYWSAGKAQQPDPTRRNPSASLLAHSNGARPAATSTDPVSSRSSTDSFLKAERACAEAFSGSNVDIPAVHAIVDSDQADVGDAISHHNPLYTDNEYDSMTESQSNLCEDDVSTASQPPVPPPHAESVIATRMTQQQRQQPSLIGHTSNHCHSPLNGLNGQPAVPTAAPWLSTSSSSSSRAEPNGYYDVFAGGHLALSQGQHHNGQRNKEAPCFRSDSAVNHRLLNFPDIQRPSSPVYYRDTALIAASNYVNGSLSPKPPPPPATFDGAHPLWPTPMGSQPHMVAWSVHNSPVSTALTTAVDQHLSVPCARNGTCQLLSKNEGEGRVTLHPPTAIPFIQPAGISETTNAQSDSSDGDYPGTNSLGPLSLAVQPSSVGDGGMTSSDENNEDAFSHPSDPSPKPSFGPPPYTTWFPHAPPPPPPAAAACMTDSLVANPDLDAGPPSDLGDEVCSGAPASPPAPIPSQYAYPGLSGSPSNRPAIFYPLQSAGNDEIFAYHNNPGCTTGHIYCPSSLPPKAVSASVIKPAAAVIEVASMDRVDPTSRLLRPCLPDVAPVHLPANFLQHRPPFGSVSQITSDYDNLCSGPNPSGPIDRPIPMNEFSRVPDTMNGHNGDTNSSIYESEDEPGNPIPFPADRIGLCTSSYRDPVLLRGVPTSSTCPQAPVAFQPAELAFDVNRNQHGTSSTASQASSSDHHSHHRSEYDNVDRSTGCSTSASESLSPPTRPRPSFRLKTKRPACHEHRSHSGHSRKHHRSGSREPDHVNGRDRSLFNAEIIAEARRISQQFRAAGWIPATAFGNRFDGQQQQHQQSEAIPVTDSAHFAQHELLSGHQRLDHIDYATTTVPCSQWPLATPTAGSQQAWVNQTNGKMCGGHHTESLGPAHDQSANGRSFSHLLIGPRSFSATCLDTLDTHQSAREMLPGDSSSSSLVSSLDDEEAEGTGLPEIPYSNDHDDSGSRFDPLQPSRPITKRPSAQPPSDALVTSPRFVRLQRRAARVRSLIPPELHRFLLPSCMSSLSRSSSRTSGSRGRFTFANHDWLFLSMARDRLQSGGHAAAAAGTRQGHGLYRATSDPLIHAGGGH